MPRMTAQEKRWQAESDVRLLRDYAMLQADSARHKAATETLAAEQAQVNKVLAMLDVETMTETEINANGGAVSKALSS